MYIGFYPRSYLFLLLSHYQSDHCPIILLQICSYRNSILLSTLRSIRLNSFILLPSIWDQHPLTALICSCAFSLGMMSHAANDESHRPIHILSLLSKKKEYGYPSLGKNASQVGPPTFLLNEYAFSIFVDLTYFKRFIRKGKYWWLNIMDI